MTKNTLRSLVVLYSVVDFCFHIEATHAGQNKIIAISANRPQPVFQVDLEVDKARAWINLAEVNGDKVKIKGKFRLAAGSDDIQIATNPLGLKVFNDPVTVNFSGRPEFNKTFPAGSLVEVKPLSNKYVGNLSPASGPVNEISIRYSPGSNKGKFSVTWNKFDLVAEPRPTVEEELMASDPSSTQPVAVDFDMDIGNHNGVVKGIHFKLTKDKKNTIEYEYLPPDEVN